MTNPVLYFALVGIALGLAISLLCVVHDFMRFLKLGQWQDEELRWYQDCARRSQSAVIRKNRELRRLRLELAEEQAAGAAWRDVALSRGDGAAGYARSGHEVVKRLAEAREREVCIRQLKKVIG